MVISWGAPVAGAQPLPRWARVMGQCTVLVGTLYIINHIALLGAYHWRQCLKRKLRRQLWPPLSADLVHLLLRWLAHCLQMRTYSLLYMAQANREEEKEKKRPQLLVVIQQEAW